MYYLLVATLAIIIFGIIVWTTLTIDRKNSPFFQFPKEFSGEHKHVINIKPLTQEQIDQIKRVGEAKRNGQTIKTTNTGLRYVHRDKIFRDVNGVFFIAKTELALTRKEFLEWTGVYGVGRRLPFDAVEIRRYPPGGNNSTETFKVYDIGVKDHPHGEDIQTDDPYYCCQPRKVGFAMDPARHIALKNKPVKYQVIEEDEEEENDS